MQRFSTFALLSLVVLTAEILRADAGPVRAGFDHPELSTLARQVPVGGLLRIEDVDLNGTKQRTTFELERFEVFAPDARVVVHGHEGDTILPLPNNVYFRGSIAGDPRSSVFLTSLSTGALRGLATTGGDYWVLSAEARGLRAAAGLQLRKIDAATEVAGETGGFACGNDRLFAFDQDASRAARGVRDAARHKVPASSKVSASYTARVAVETDYEFFLRFADASQATDYIGDLFAYMSGIYSAEVATNILVSHVSLWSTSGDPWSQTSPICGLFEFGRYWNDNNDNIERTIAHFLSGKNNGGGVAWVGVLCSSGFNYSGGASSGCPALVPDFDNYGGAYGYTGDIDGNFDIDNPAAVWDIVAASHEVGHNFNSPHTHCYAGLNGNSEPVDECNSSQCGSSGCYCGSPSLPCGQSGAGCGTIMSYCHTLSGSLGNIALTLGLSHPHGVEPDRVPNRMFDHVASRASSDPSCLAYEESLSQIFTDGFESGNTSQWQ